MTRETVWRTAKLTLKGTGPSGKPIQLEFDCKKVDPPFAEALIEAIAQMLKRQRQQEAKPEPVSKQAPSGPR